MSYAIFELKPRETSLLPPEEIASFEHFVESCYHDPKIFAKTPAPRGKKPSELSVEEWISIYRASN
jgi:hypothetical protein